LNDITDQTDLTDIYRVFHPATAKLILLAAHRAFSKTDHVLGLKVSFNKYKKIELPPAYCLTKQNKTRTQQQKKLQKILRHLETEQHIAP
jgi:hypothetical protein